MKITDRPFRSFLVLAVAPALLLGATAASAQQGSPAPLDPAAPGIVDAQPGDIVHSWALAPTVRNPEQGSGRPNLSYELAPGGEVTDEVTLFNYSNVQLTFRLYATDAFNNDDGDFDLLPGDQQPTALGTWVSLPQGAITMPAKTQATFPITVKVPDAARPGDYAGAVLASSRAEGTQPDGKVVGLDRRTGTRVYVRVSGRLAPALAVEGLKASYDPALNPAGGTADVQYRIVNRGNVRMSGTHRPSVAGPLGIGRTSGSEVRIPELLPGESIQVRTKLRGVLASGLAVAEVALRPDPVGSDLKSPAATERRSFALAVPVTLLAAGVALLLARRAARSYRRRQLPLEAIAP